MGWISQIVLVRIHARELDSLEQRVTKERTAQLSPAVREQRAPSLEERRPRDGRCGGSVCVRDLDAHGGPVPGCCACHGAGGIGSTGEPGGSTSMAVFMRSVTYGFQLVWR
jgi:hypothetical protein